ncbi:hypothetical protein IVA96_12495 [Bradyrhizobium sp. 159]|uniref:hypothetical protein n=1 Tax=unclassified Bradyrhizobium TaxID=2631580 RepID=UPI001FFB153C|nr:MULTISPECIES: hypothetical protein [unclassified Bradyrhizobium]MCK1617450.1 hypothetical protein [Bradyrhizobium sp. 159]MCK1669736.1 hypothetical protein [Bradyrhizobium sp. 153]
MPYFVCARDGVGQIILNRDTREAAEKKAAELRDVGYFEVEIIAKAAEKAA